MRRRTSTALGAVLAVLVAGAAAVAPASAVEDTTAPTITAITLLTPTVSAGDAIALRFTAQDDLSGVNSLTAQLSGPDGTTVGLLSPGGDATFLGPTGLVAGVVPLGAPAGTYTLVSALVADKAGNQTVYGVGTADSLPPSAAAPIDLGPGTVTVLQPVARDTTAPQITSFTMLTQGDRHPGEFVTFGFTTSDNLSPVTELSVRMCDPLDAQAIGVRGGGILSSGRLSVWIPPDKASGFTWHVCGVSIKDSSGNARSYSYPSMSVQLTAGQPRLDPLVMQDERPDPVVSTVPTRSLVATGTAISIGGTVTFLGQAVPYPVVAVYAERAGARTLVGVTRGTATGAFAKRVVVAGTTVYRTYFLGSDRGGFASGPNIGPGARVWAGVPQTLTVAATTVKVPAGRTGTLVVTLQPRRIATVTLWRWTGRSWAKVTSVRSRSTGVAAVRVARPRVSALYRWTTAYDGVGLAAASRTVTVRAV